MYSQAQEALAAYFERVVKDDFTARCHLSGNGDVESFENKLKEFYGMKHALSVDSATNGFLYLALAIGLRNTEIVTSPLSYGATISGALWLNNKFHFADIDNTLNISHDAVRKILKANPRIKALYAVDFGGIPHDMFSIRQICDEFGIWYFADAAQSLGAKIGDIKASSLADAFVLSFSPGKTVFCGEGGCILTNDTDLYKRLITITQHPYRMKKDVGLDLYSELGLNGRMNPLAAVVGNAIFDDCMENIKSKQFEILKLYAEMDCFRSLTPFHFKVKSFFPAFYYLPLLVNNRKEFEKEFNHVNGTFNKKYSFQKNSFEPLTEQIKRIGKACAVKSNYTPNAKSLLKKLFLLQKI